MACIFFYLIILIFYKWTHYDASQATDAPALLIRLFSIRTIRNRRKNTRFFSSHRLDLIGMVLMSYPDEPPSSRKFYSGQQVLQTILLVIAVLCVPWMLLGKPIYRIVMNKRRANVSRVKNLFVLFSISTFVQYKVFISET